MNGPGTHEPGTPRPTQDALGDLDDVPIADDPDTAVAESLQQALRELRAEADRIESLDTSVEQVEAADQIATDAAALDEQVGGAARQAGE